MPNARPHRGPYLAAVDTRLGPLSAWLAAHRPASHQALFDADRAVFGPDAPRARLWQKAATPLDQQRQAAWALAQKSTRAATELAHPPREIQRSGLLGHPELHGRLFPALRAAALGAPLPPDLDAAHDRYYAQLPEMPGDLDSAAAIALHGGPASLLPAALERLTWALAQDPVPVWDAPGWFGPHCPAVTARAVEAAAAHGLPVPQRVLDGLLALAPWVRAVHYPDPVLASAMVARALRAHGQRHGALERMFATAPCAQWSALATASVASFGGARLSLRRQEQLLVRLLTLQRWDGSFPASPWYLVPGMHGGMQPFGSSALNTWAALRALEALQPRPVADLQGEAQR